MTESLEYQLQRLSDEVKERIGTDWYLYLSRPGDGQTRYVFQDGVKPSLRAAVAHMAAKHAEVFKEEA